MTNTEIIRLDPLAKKIGVSKCTIWRWRNAGLFPKPINLGPRVIGWRANDIQDWLNSRNQIA